MQEKNQPQHDRRGFLKTSTALIAGLPFLGFLDGCNASYNLENVTMDEVLDSLRQGDRVEDYISRFIQHINNHNNRLKAVIEINPDALSIARNLDAYYSRTKDLIGPLHGLLKAITLIIPISCFVTIAVLNNVSVIPFTGRPIAEFEFDQE